MTEQLLNADVVVLRGVQNRAALSGLRAAIHSANPGAQVVRNRRSEIVRALEKPQLPPLLLLALACGAALCLRQLLGAELNTTITVFLGIMLQAVPFLLIGVLLSSAIQLFLSQQFIERFSRKIASAARCLQFWRGQRCRYATVHPSRFSAVCCARASRSAQRSLLCLSRRSSTR